MRFLIQLIMILIIRNPLNMLIASHHFKSNETISDDTSSSDDQNPSQDDLFQNSSNTNPPLITTSPFKQILKAPDNIYYSDRTRHPSKNQSTPPYATHSRYTKTHYNLGE